MLGNLDAAIGDSLRSFDQSLLQAQHGLQQDQARVDATASLLHDLSAANAVLRDAKVHNAQEQRRLDALRAEKAKLTRQCGHKKEQISSCLAHVQQLAQPRLAQLAATERERQAVRVLRRNYCVRAAQVHGYVAQFMDHTNNLVSLEAQRVQLQRQRVDSEAAVAQLRQSLTEVEKAMAVLKAAAEHAVSQTTELQEMGGGDATADQNKGSPMNIPAGAVAAGDTINGTGASVAEKAVTDSPQERHLAQKEAYAVAQARYAEEAAHLQQRRAALKEEVLQLCREIEVSDAAQQMELRAYHDALNQAGSTDTARVCGWCQRDILRDFS